MIASVGISDFAPRGNSRKTICVSTQTINNRRRRSRTRWFMVNLNWIFIRWHAWICARHGTRGRASRLVFARGFQLCQSYPDRMHFAKIYCPRSFHAIFVNVRVRDAAKSFREQSKQIQHHLYYLSKISFKTELAKAPYCLDKFWITRGLQFTFISRAANLFVFFI